MGKKIVCESCGTIFPFERAKDFTVCPVCNASFDDEENETSSAHDENPKTDDGHSDWITWYYYKDEETNCFTLRDEPIDLEVWTDTKLVKEFKAPQEIRQGIPIKQRKFSEHTFQMLFQNQRRKKYRFPAPGVEVLNIHY